MTARRGGHPRLYSIWTDMRRRCVNPKRPDFKWYGARGIAVCPEWVSAKAFIEWALVNGYAENLTIDRKDVDGDYEPSNCRWSTIKEQERNRRNNDVIEFRGERLCLSEWAERLGLTPPAVWRRLYRYGWTIEKALGTPKGGFV